MAKFVEECVNISFGKVRSCIPMRDKLIVSDQPYSWILFWKYRARGVAEPNCALLSSVG